MTPDFIDGPEFSPLKTAVKGLGSAALTVGAVVLTKAANRNGVPVDVDTMTLVTSALAGGLLGMLRNFLKQKAPRLFGWLP